jgi:hypothetical protein
MDMNMDTEIDTNALLLNLGEVKKHIDMLETFIKNIQKKEIKQTLEPIKEEEPKNEPIILDDSIIGIQELSISNVKLKITEPQPQPEEVSKVELKEEECYLYPQPPPQQQSKIEEQYELNKYVNNFFASFNIPSLEKEEKEKEIKKSSFSETKDSRRSKHSERDSDYYRKRKYDEEDDIYYQSKRKYDDTHHQSQRKYDDTHHQSKLKYDDEELHGNDGPHSDFLVDKHEILQYKMNCPYGNKCFNSSCIKSHKELILTHKKVIFDQYPPKELFSDRSSRYYFKKNCCFGDKCLRFKENDCDFNHYPLKKM